MKSALRSKSFLITTHSTLNFQAHVSSRFSIKDSLISDSLKNIPLLEACESGSEHSKEPSLKGMEDVYNFNKSIKINNASLIEKIASPLLPKSKTNDPSLILSTIGSQRRESSPIQLKYKKRNQSVVFSFQETFVDTLKRILSKSFYDRNEEDISNLVKILSQITFFETLGVQKEQNLIERCCRYINIEFCAKGCTVFLYGSQGTKFYIILQGSVGVLLPKNGSFLRSEEFQEVKILKDGDSFGELALISKKTRSASIVCKEDCYFAVLEKKYFFEILCLLIFL